MHHFLLFLCCCCFSLVIRLWKTIFRRRRSVEIMDAPASRDFADKIWSTVRCAGSTCPGCCPTSRNSICLPGHQQFRVYSSHCGTAYQGYSITDWIYCNWSRRWLMSSNGQKEKLRKNKHKSDTNNAIELRSCVAQPLTLKKKDFSHSLRVTYNAW